ncbi:CRISPR-associated protein, Cse4 family [Kytococcus aerolatus]|uniref:CRISPR-associated protein, Cse4 family n=1 Tax=Kytococcus aerolatus TaxID=592308 RepID=A0A212U5H0_9MICO|nr:type I-E CRISPR-associated protein Cas7/Cse4/CasC [Kytococcus aerolatus]SNC73489.1 CRISPR-associated protein, Cse4 family [Kytococcus aerolatus]
MSRYIDIHVLQTVPPANLNRDDTGSPKSAVYGGVRRTRVSSQAWKRAVRQDFPSLLAPEDLGSRTKRIVELVARELMQRDLEEAEALEAATGVLEQAGIKVEVPKRKAKDEGAKPESRALVFLGAHQIRELADVALARRAGGLDDKEFKARAKRAAVESQSIDLALFGRMVAESPDLNVDAAVQVAHAIGVQAGDNEFDYYTAVDDLNTDAETGAGMIGTIEFTSATLYRYATVNVASLFENLGDAEATERAVNAFVTSFVRSMPSGKQNTFANRTLPEVVLVMVRDTQPVSLVQAFEQPVVAEPGTSPSAVAAERLVRKAQQVEAMYDEQPVEVLAIHDGGVTSLSEWVSPSTLTEVAGRAGKLAVASVAEESA